MGNISASVIIKKEFQDIINSYFMNKFLNSAIINKEDNVPDNLKNIIIKNNRAIPNGYVNITCSFPDGNNAFKKRVKKFLNYLNIENKLTFTKIPDSLEEWQSFYKVMTINGFKILPPWLAVKEQNNVIKINPGAGYGAGEHATSKLCLNQIKNLNIKGKKIADLGAGSGIIGITCNKLGSGNVLMIENDKTSLDKASENIELNNVSKNIRIMDIDLTQKQIPGIENYDIIFCNVWPHVNKMVVELNHIKFKKKALILFTGVFKKDHNDFYDFLEKNKFRVYDIKVLENWYLYITEHVG